MSKSLGNIILVRDILKRYPADAVRMLALQTHYRNPIDFGPEALDEAKRAYERVENCLFALDAFLAKPSSRTAPQRTQKEVELTDSYFDFERRFEEAMDDDFNTARAIGVIFELVKELNTCLDEQERYRTPAAPIVVSHGRDVLMKMCTTLGLCSGAEAAESREEAGGPESGSGAFPTAESLVDLLLEVRTAARKAGHFEIADLIRARLREVGIRVDDLREGQRWKFVGPPE